MGRPGTPDAPSRRRRTAPRLAYLFTRFPYLTETFLQREVLAMQRLGCAPEMLYSLHRGGGAFSGRPVRTFAKWRLLSLLWKVWPECLQNPDAVAALARRLFLTWPRDWINHWENLYGAGIAVVLAGEFRRAGITHAHAVWASLPATTAWILSLLAGVRFSMGAHAYDLFEHGGDWLLREKCRAAAFVHTSTECGRRRLLALGVEPERIVLARRGLLPFPPCRPLRPHRDPLRLLCIARLVEKKGLLRQVGLYRQARASGLRFSARLVGDGPLRGRLESEIARQGLGDVVTLAGARSNPEVWAELASADVLLHTGVVSGSGDRDGLPNVVPEAMAAGVLVVTAPAPGVEEAIEDGGTGMVCPLEDPEAWTRAFARIQDDDGLAEHLRVAARRWAEENFDAVRNARLILERFEAALPEPAQGWRFSPGRESDHAVV